MGYARDPRSTATLITHPTASQVAAAWTAAPGAELPGRWRFALPTEAEWLAAAAAYPAVIPAPLAVSRGPAAAPDAAGPRAWEWCADRDGPGGIRRVLRRGRGDGPRDRASAHPADADIHTVARLVLRGPVREF